MSLFKRKQSKEKDIPAGIAAAGEAPGSSPPVASTAQMAQMGGMPNGSLGQARPPPGVPGVMPQGQGPYVNGSTPPMANGRRMTSNPMQGPPGVQNNGNGPISQGYDGAPAPNGVPAQGPTPPYPNGPPGAVGSPSQNTVNGANSRQSTIANPSYPWSTRPVRLYAPQTSPPSAPTSPFPRYGLSVPAFPSHSGHMLIFGGLVHEHVRNDLWSMDVRDCSTMPVKTKGDSPIARVGHASAIADRIMLVWGGDTKVKQDDSQDEGLYILDLRTQEWTRVPVAAGPVGRYGHAVTMYETKFYVFGGQAEGEFMNDLWAYDIRQLSSDKQHRWDQISYASPAPPRRTGHVLVSHQGKLYLFGGTDGNYHYNDTWAFDIATNTWTELSCIGYIPVPREGHAAAIVDDVMYIFGGRDVNGKDLGDLAAFRITNQRWYMFQNMGPAPTARSGHAMVAAHGKIFVVGGEANASSPQVRDDPSLVHVLDTTKIKYPPDNQPPRQVKPRMSDAPSQHTEKSYNPADTPQSVKKSITNSGSMDSLARATSPLGSSDRLAQLAQSPPVSLGAAVPPTQHPTRSESQDIAARNGPNGPPQRPRREGDDEYRRAMSPTNGGSGSPTQPNFRVTSPNGTNPASPPQVKNGFNPSVLGTRSPSPRMRTSDADRPAPPPDAFYYGRSPTANGFNQPNRPSSMSSAADLMRELKAKEGEVESGRQREAALRVIIARARSAGFVPDAGDESDDEDESDDVNGDEGVVRKLADALVRLKQEKAAIQNDLVAQVQVASDRANEAERLRRGALQEAAFFRAKVATLESNSPTDLARIEKERITELERQIAALHNDHATTLRDLEKFHNDTTSSRDLHVASSQREANTLQRAEAAEEAHRMAIEEVEELQYKAKMAETNLREHSERAVSLASAAQQREAERDRLQSQLDEAVSQRDGHLALIEQVQAAVAAAGSRHVDLESMHEKATKRIESLERELADTKAEMDSRSREVDNARSRMVEVENAYAKSREEADSLRNVTTSRLGELLESHRNLRADDSRSVRGHQDQVRALEEEGNSLRKMLKEAGQRLDAAEAGVSSHRTRMRELELECQGLRGQVRESRTRLIGAQMEIGKLKEAQGNKDAELKERDFAVTEIETRCNMLRNLLAEHGIAVNDSDLANAEAPSTRELETQLKDRTRAHENAQREVEELQRRCNEAEDKVESLGRLVDRIKDARSPTSMSMRSPTPPPDTDRRMLDAERRMVELESQHKEKMAALEGDYQTAVRYVKGTEKMLKRMKDELNKQKAANATLQGEIDGLTGRSSTEPGARTRDASGRATPSSNDAELHRRIDKLQTQHNALQAELQASRDVLSAREREVEVLRMRCEEAEREVETLRDDLAQAQQRIGTLLDMGGEGFGLGSDDERRQSLGSATSEEASMAFDKFTKELKQWERSRSPQNGHDGLVDSDEEVPRLSKGGLGKKEVVAQGGKGHKRGSSEYSGDWVQ